MSTDAGSSNGSAPSASRSGDRTLAEALGWASLGLGVPQTVAPGRFDRFIGVEPAAKPRAITIAACGVRELAAAAGILVLGRRRPAGWLWARAAGDALDLVLLARALRHHSERPGRIAGAIGAVAGVAAVDLYAAARLSRGSARLPVKAAITVRRPVDEVYGFWRDVGNFPHFMHHLESVEVRGEGRSHWTAKAPIGTVEWDAELTEDRANERIAWRSLEGSKIQHSGSVSFRKGPRDEGTEILLELHYDAPGGVLGATLAKLSGEEPRQQVKDDLRRFKQVVETGEVVRSDGSPEGQRARRHLKQRAAAPPEEAAPPQEPTAAAGETPMERSRA